MGMSASQCRLLNLTARMSDLEYQAQSISNSKIRLATQTEEIARNYSDALNKEKLTIQTGVDQNGVTTYKDATAANLTGYNTISTTEKQRFIKDSAGKVVLSEKLANIMNSVMTPGSFGNQSLKSAEDYKNMSLAEMNVNGAFVEFVYGAEGRPDINGDGKHDMIDYNALIGNIGDSKVQYYKNIFVETLESGGCNGQSSQNLNSPEWLQQQVQSGNISLYEADSTGDFQDVSWTSCDSSIQSKSDTTDMARAEADYKVKTAEIQTKDKRFDLDLQNINTEHTAIQTEVDSVKKTIEKNIDRSFKIFNA